MQNRTRQARPDSQVLSQSYDAGASALATLPVPLSPSYEKGKTLNVTADLADPNASAPPVASLLPGGAGHVVWFLKSLPGGGSVTTVEVWVESDAGHGWLFVASVSPVVLRKEQSHPVGGRRSFLRVTGTAGLGVGTPAVFVATTAG